MRATRFEMRTARVGERVLVVRPAFRKLRVLAMDPGIVVRFEAGIANEATLQVPWEELKSGPVGEYIAVLDKEQAGRPLHEPVNLDDPDLVAQDGLPPSLGNPRFHHQMVYAVAMQTIGTFERALGRTVLWAQPPGQTYEKQLRVYPHHGEFDNAFYGPSEGICFGYFAVPRGSPQAGATVFTCLSPDTIAGEIALAVLAGMGLDSDATGPDTEAFWIGFSDVLGLLRRFWPSKVLSEQIGAVRGHLEQSPLLGAMALQFGQALDTAAGLRNAFGTFGPDHTWQPRRPDPAAYRKAKDPYARGSTLLYAVAEAFLKLYRWRTADLRRIATRGTGVLPEGELHPDLVSRFVQEASTVARNLLHLWIRALDYLPTGEFTFGDYLRALVTADHDVDPADSRRHQAALMEAFRAYAIHPPGGAGPSLETLLWPRPEEEGAVAALAAFARDLSRRQTYWSLPTERERLWALFEATAVDLAAHLRSAVKAPRRLGGIDLAKAFEVRFMPMERTRGTGQLSISWVIRLSQRRAPVRGPRGKEGPLAAGCTLVVDAASGTVLYQIDAVPGAPAHGRRRGASLLDPGPTSHTPPAERHLRVFAFDPSLGARLETAGINEVTIRVPWERDAQGRDVLEPGPVGEYLAVVDRDPASRCFYDPVDLNAVELVAEDGLPPSESNPQFHQQMVYAVAMRTVRTFELALGRLALWAPRRVRDAEGNVETHEYVQRLRVYPHALREANAYYSPAKKALLFGYFPAPVARGHEDAPRLTVFTCLSHDIVAHEVTHALLDGMHTRFNEPSNPDVLAFHEAFADLVALFQHFSLPEVLRHQIAQTRGDLASQNRLGELAQQFGQAIGNRGALRSAIGEIDSKTLQWRPLEPDPEAYRTVQEPHDRGAILVAAVFDAFLTLYKARIADLLRIATEGTGVLPAGELHPDLVNRLADEAARTARHILEMCIRALDYCPPVDITFGDYVRAIVTADFEYDPVDVEHRRVAFVEAFRRRGIAPEDVRTLSVDGLLWRPTSAAPDEDENVLLNIVGSWIADIRSWDLSRDRHALFDLMADRRAALHAYIAQQQQRGSAVPAGIDPSLPFEVHSIRPSIRSDWEGRARFQWIIELTQRVPEFLEAGDAEEGSAEPDYYFRGGCTLVVDAEDGRVRYSIRKRFDDIRRKRQRRYLEDEGNRSLSATYFGGVAGEDQEPFAMLHRL